MLRERPLERVAPVNGDAGGDAVVGETAPPDHEAQGVLQRLKPRQKAVPLDRDARAGCSRSMNSSSSSSRLYIEAMIAYGRTRTEPVRAPRAPARSIDSRCVSPPPSSDATAVCRRCT